MFDIHNHILPNVDDGSKSIEESLLMIDMLYQQGIKKIVLTPHVQN
ncbi:CpsB/CapC family capsule biosynthesis tyrosine phosphatase, partial [Acholeplasma equifetale]